MLTRIAASAFLLIFVNGAMADATIVMSEAHEKMPGGKGQTKMLVKDGRLVMEQMGQNQSVLFDSETNSMTQIDHGRKEYMVMDDATLDQAESQMGQMMKELEKQLAGMSEQEKKMVMQHMPKNLPGMQKQAPKVYQVKQLGRNDKVAGYKCKMVEMHEDGALETTACVASASTLGLSKGDYATIAKMIDMMQSFADRFAQAGSGIPSLDEMGGLPIMSSAADGSNRSQLVSVDLGSLDAEIFEIPAEYNQRSMMQR